MDKSYPESDDKAMETIQVVLEMLDAIKHTNTDKELDDEFKRILKEHSPNGEESS